MLHWWSDFRSRFDLVSPCETLIWNNYNIRVNGKPIFYNNYTLAQNIVLLKDFKFDLSNTYLDWSSLRFTMSSKTNSKPRS